MWLRILIIYTWLLANFRTTKAFTLPRVCGSDQPKFYDVDKNVCCNGTLYPLLARNGTRYGCCSRTDLDTQVLYDKDVYLCCGTQLVPLYDGAYKRECCKGDKEFQEIQEKGKTCCNGRSHYLKKNEDCCDTMKFNTEQFKCCRDDKLVDASLHRLNDSIRYQGCCGSNTFDEEKSWCDDRTEPPVVKSKHIAVCNGTDYDDRTHVCCHDEYGPLLTKPDVDPRYPKKFGCCNKRLINTQDEKCCSGNTEEGITEHAIYKDRICCGNESVADSRTEECCNGVPNKIDARSAQEPYKCCGTRFVKEMNCCNGKEIPPEYSCCGGTVRYSKNSAYSCCNGEVFGTNHQLCCQKSSAIKFLIDKETSTDTDCCWSTLTPYNRFTHYCTAKGIHMRPETRNANLLVCPYCRRRIDTGPSTYCKAKNVFEVNITSIRETETGSVLNTVTDSGSCIRIRIPYRCHCLREDTRYLIFTSRRNRKGRMRLKSKSMFFTKDDYEKGEDKDVCGLEKKIRRRIRNQSRKTIKQPTE